MITVLKHIKNHDKIASLECMLEVITVLEKNYAHDDRVPVKAWDTLYYWLEKYYCELKDMLIMEKEFKEYGNKRNIKSFI